MSYNKGDMLEDFSSQPADTTDPLKDPLFEQGKGDDSAAEAPAQAPQEQSAEESKQEENK